MSDVTIDTTKQNNKDLASAIRTIESEIETLKKLPESLGDNLTLAIEAMLHAKGRVIITGMGKSGHIGKKIAASLASTGTPSFFIHPAEASHGDLGMITTDDVVIAISNSGESRELVDILNYCKRFGITIIAITKKIKSTLGSAGDIVLPLPDNGEACPLGLAPTSSTTATLVLGDILTVALIERRGFTKEDFNARHPGGKLGSVLQRVSDLMHTGEELPLLSQDSTMQQALLEMTSKRFGCVGFVNADRELVGILTDGDLRRCLANNMLENPASLYMIRTPKVLKKEMLASEALKFMNDLKITNSFVVENNKPIGVIHMHDLLKNAVV